jgi:hypothetical protein
MAKWSKEDRHNYEKSEVFQEFEKITISNIFRLDMLRKKAQQSAVNPAGLKATTQAVKETTQAIKDLGQATKEVGLAEDQLSDGGDEYMLSGFSKEIAEKMMNQDEDKELSETIVNELMEMKEAAIKEGNIKLAYKIERTLDEIFSVEVI